MNSLPQQLESAQILDIPWADRWLVYYRLKDLGIPCYCATNQPLQVQINHPVAAMQVWSVSQQLIASRDKLIPWLQRCYSGSL